jgi:O-antigen/teichoic acid export membrane protein
MSMAWANLFNIVVSTGVYACLRPAHQPLLPSFKGWRSIAHFGGGSALSSLMMNMDTALPDTLIGKRLDAHAVGLYSRGNSLVDLFAQVVMPAVNNTAVPVIAKSFHEQRPLSADLCKSLAYISGIAWPVLLITGLFAEDMIRVLYGEKWLECLPVVLYLCFASAVRTPFGLTTNALLGIGRPYISAATIGATILLKVTIALALQAVDLRGFAIAFMLADFISCPIVIAVWRRQFRVSLREMWQALLPSIFLVIPLAALALAMRQLPDTWPALSRLACIGAVLMPAWLALLHATKHPLSEETGLIMARFAKRKSEAL